MILPELAALMEKFGMDPFTSQILYIPSMDDDPIDSIVGFPNSIPIVPTIIENQITGERAVAILPQSEIQKMKPVNVPRGQQTTLLPLKPKVN